MLAKHALITAASNKFFPSLLNLLGSISKNYPNCPEIFVYDLGLLPNFRAELKNLPNIKVLPMPKFCGFWRSCYTWKCYIFSHPLAEYNLYLDAGCQVLRPLDEIYDHIKKDDYFAVSQGLGGGSDLHWIVPKEYKRLFPVAEQYYFKECATAGVFGFKANSKITSSLNELYDCALAGLALGFSLNEQYKNKGQNKNPFVRDCKMFRHDTTLLSLILRKNFGDCVLHPLEKYAGWLSPKDDPNQLIWNLRLNFKALEFLPQSYLHSKFSPLAAFNRVAVNAMLVLKNLKKLLKNLS